MGFEVHIEHYVVGDSLVWLAKCSAEWSNFIDSVATLQENIISMGGGWVCGVDGWG